MVEKSRKKVIEKVSVKKVAKKGLSQTHPKLAEEADGWNPQDFFASHNKKVSWKCAIGHEWDATIKSRVAGRG